MKLSPLRRSGVRFMESCPRKDACAAPTTEGVLLDAPITMSTDADDALAS